MNRIGKAMVGIALGICLTATAGADELSGPGRATMSNETWGTIYYVPQDLKEYDYSGLNDQGVRLIQSPLGKVTIREDGPADYTLEGPDGSIKVDSEPKQVKVWWRGRAYEFTRSANELVVKTPDDRISYTLKGNQIIITGREGTTTITQSDGDYKVESPKGIYTYSPTPEGGFRVRGGPLAEYPYLFRGALFQNAGVGIFVDFKKLDPESPLFRFIEWYPMLTIE